MHLSAGTMRGAHTLVLNVTLRIQKETGAAAHVSAVTAHTPGRDVRRSGVCGRDTICFRVHAQRWGAGVLAADGLCQCQSRHVCARVCLPAKPNSVAGALYLAMLMMLTMLTLLTMRCKSRCSRLALLQDARQGGESSRVGDAAVEGRGLRSRTLCQRAGRGQACGTRPLDYHPAAAATALLLPAHCCYHRTAAPIPLL